MMLSAMVFVTTIESRPRHVCIAVTVCICKYMHVPEGPKECGHERRWAAVS